MKRTIGNFVWKSGSINDNIAKLLNERGMEWTRTFNGDILVDAYGIRMWEKVQYALTDEASETYTTYLD